MKDEKDRAYIYVQKKNLVIDLHIELSYVNELEKEDFIIKPRDNFQPFVTKNIKHLIIADRRRLVKSILPFCPVFPPNELPAQIICRPLVRVITAISGGQKYRTATLVVPTPREV